MCICEDGFWICISIRDGYVAYSMAFGTRGTDGAWGGCFGHVISTELTFI